MATSTPVKAVRACLTCNRSSQGHLKNLKNVAMRSIIFRQHFEILNLNIDELIKMENDKFLICDTCLKTLDKVSEMRSALKKNIIQHKKHQERYKRLILHSVSPVVKKFKDKVFPVKSRRSSKALFKFSSPEKSVEIRSIEQNVELPVAADTDDTCHTSDQMYHAYSVLPAKQNSVHSEHSYISTGNTTELDKTDSVGLYQHHKTKILMPIKFRKEDEENVLSVIKQTSDGGIDDVLKTMLAIPSVHERLWQLILLKVSMEVDQIRGTKNPSVIGNTEARYILVTF